MKRVLAGLFGGLLLIVGPGLTAPAGAAKCPADSVESGTVCMDKYEASVWHVPPTQEGLINKIQKGEVKLTDLTSVPALAAGVVQVGLVGGDLAAAGCPDTGNGCVDFYAVSIPGVTPSAFITWFQAAAAARNSLKRLPTNQEWQAAALGTTDGAPCNVSSGSVANTGSAAGCVSDVGAFDMVGNLDEWVADWVPRSTTCGAWLPFSDDFQCLAGASTSFDAPGALIRGGDWLSGTFAGVFAVSGRFTPSSALGVIGFRAAR
jgi:hypothetical protein